MKKTNAVRIIESFNIPYELKEYEFDENDLSGITAANKINMDPDSVFKTLVANGDRNGIVVFSIPVSTELDLKKAARCSGNKNVELVKINDLLSLTGYLRGGCSPIGMKKNYPLFIDQSVILSEKISVSAGVRGLQVIISPDDLIRITGGIIAELI